MKQELKKECGCIKWCWSDVDRRKTYCACKHGRSELEPEQLNNEHLEDVSAQKDEKVSDHRPYLACSNCDSTWSDPQRAISFLTKWMRDKPALKHNVSPEKWEVELKLYLTSAGDRRRTIAFIHKLLKEQRERIVEEIEKEL